ncbi:DedA family protein [Raineyella fluvialis]|uniref:DedA family protein n=1 Tax=Raineyella fluvialis TaxID=2662261 RepID=A0A5Q2FEK7_9ACTN|nr:DedA family protein [Raineyella fluvialis]QGF23155.1 DedA family protein [Raineyella fluvialis]
MSFITFLHSIPPVAVYALIGLLVGIESIGVPVPGETALIAGSLMSSRSELHISPIWVALAAFAGAVIGDSIGYSVGRHFGPALLDRLAVRFPRHVSADRILYAEHLFARYGVGTVFLGRFIALLRMFAGPLAGALKLTYPRFLMANASGAACWAGGITLLVHFLGMAAERYVKDASWGLFGVAAIVSLVVGRLIGRTFERRVEAYAAERRAAEVDPEGPAEAL